jgi:uncharacterized protein HemY
MRNRLYALLLTFAGIAAGKVIYAQNNNVVESTMRSNGKIYVVLAVCLTILIGLIAYLVTIDRKIARIEEKQ